MKDGGFRICQGFLEILSYSNKMRENIQECIEIYSYFGRNMGNQDEKLQNMIVRIKENERRKENALNKGK